MFKTQIVVLVVIKRDNKFLLTRRHSPEDKRTHNKWQFAGGGLEFGETPEDTLIREAKEELGIDVKIVKLIPVIKDKIIGKWQGLFIPYLCEADSYENIQLDDETNKYDWFEESEIDSLDLLDGNSEIIRSIIKAL